MGGSLNLRRLKFKAVREYYTTVKESFRSTERVLDDATVISDMSVQLPKPGDFSGCDQRSMVGSVLFLRICGNVFESKTIAAPAAITEGRCHGTKIP